MYICIHIHIYKHTMFTGGALNALNSNARNAISSQSCSFKRKCLVTSARESL